jgi:hypothetical protein
MTSSNVASANGKKKSSLQEYHVLALRQCRRTVARHLRTLVALLQEFDFAAIGTQAVRCAVGGTIVNSKNFEVLKGLSEYGVDALLEIFLP